MPCLACLFVPDFRLQVALANLDGEPLGGLALVDPEDGRRLVVAASPNARVDGVVRGMTAVAAAALAPELMVREIDRTALAAASRALEERVRAVCPVFESTSEGVIYAVFDGLEGRYGEDGVGGFLDDLRDAAERLDLPARIGLAGTRFAARAAAVMEGKLPGYGRGAIRVPPGGEAAFLRGLPTRLLPDAIELVAALEQLGITTLGDFAALPGDGVLRRWGQQGLGLHRLARGEDRGTLQPTAEPRRFFVEAHAEAPIDRVDALRFFVKGPLERVLGELDGSGLAARALRATLRLEGAEPLVRVTHAAAPTASLRLWTDLLAVSFEGLTLQGGVLTVQLEAEGVGPASSAQERLVGPRAAPPGARSMTLAHLAAEVGPARYGHSRPKAAVFPEERQEVGGGPEERDGLFGAALLRAQERRAVEDELWVADRAGEGALPPAFRRVFPREAIEVEERQGRPLRFRHRDGWFRVDVCHGPFEVSTGWWTARGERARRCYSVEGPGGVARISFERGAFEEGWMLEGWLD